MAATTISRSNIGTNDDGSGTTGTVINVAYINFIYDNIDALFSSTTGIRLNQAGGDADILSLESSDVAHGITSIINTDVWGAFRKVGANDGGLVIIGATEVTRGVQVSALTTTADTTKATTSAAAIYVSGSLKSGTSTTVLTANGNIAAFATDSTVRFILDADGDSHQDVSTTWTNFDAFDDIALLNALTAGVSLPSDPLRHSFAGLLGEHRGSLEQARIVTINDHPGGDGSIFVNWSRLQMLMVGAVRQLGRENAQLSARLRALEGPSGDDTPHTAASRP